jgi:DNA-directed RNA polymerase specialized sigma24 family protein
MRAPDRDVYNDRSQAQAGPFWGEVAMSNEEFACLLAQARQGDRGALTALQGALEEKLRKDARRRLGRVLRRYVGSTDIVQSAQKSLLIYLRKGKYDIPDEQKLTALAMRILQRKVARKWRQVRRELKALDGLAQEQKARPDPPGGAPQAVENADLVERLMRYMNKTEQELVKWLLQGHTTASAAEQLGIKPAYARVLMGRMKARLATMFELPAGFP